MEQRFGGNLTQIDQLWVLLCAALVFMMQAGFMCVEAGITRSKNNISVAVKNLADLALAISIFWLCGYGIMFGASAGGWFGTSLTASQSLTSDENVQFIFQAMFCGTAATILSGAVAERCSFRGYLLITCVTALLIYPVFGHWAWAVDADGNPAGWLAKLGFHDFAGAGVVHGIGGGVALAAIIIVGARDGRFLQGGKTRRFNGSNLPMTMLGVLLLWFGWFGFNGGSALGLTDEVPGILTNTLLSGAFGILVPLLASWVISGQPKVFYGMNGGLGGLVAITAACNLVTPGAAVIIGCVGGLIVYGGDALLEKLRIDDAVGAVPVHFACGIWGLLAAALFGGISLLPQLIGIVALVVYGAVIPLIILSVINRFLPLRVSQHVEQIGLNVGEHGANTDLNELFEIMQRQARERDLTIRAPQSPFTEVGQIGLFYNSVIFELEQSAGHIKSKHDSMIDAMAEKNRLLESVLPKEIAQRMNEGEDQIVDQFADATVVFVDVVDFTSYSMERDPSVSMNMLRDLFGRFDKVIGRYDIEKIKTIGDCYMFVSGTPKARHDHCETAVEAAFELLFETNQMAIARGEDIKIRIGLHSGPLIAGVVGNHRFVYDLWGSTVNIASRLEEAGKPGKITVTDAAMDRLGPLYNFKRQGRARLRGVGPTILYSIEGRKAGMSQKPRQEPEDVDGL